MTIEHGDILKKVREIYKNELNMFSEEEIDNDTDIGKMGGIKVDGDDVSFFIEAVEKNFDVPISQADCNTLSTLRDYSKFLTKKIKEKTTPQ